MHGCVLSATMSTQVNQTPMPVWCLTRSGPQKPIEWNEHATLPQIWQLKCVPRLMMTLTGLERLWRFLCYDSDPMTNLQDCWSVYIQYNVTPCAKLLNFLLSLSPPHTQRQRDREMRERRQRGQRDERDYTKRYDREWEDRYEREDREMTKRNNREMRESVWG